MVRKALIFVINEFTLSLIDRKILEELGSEYVFSGEIKRLDLVYGGTFETTFYYSDDANSLIIETENILNAIINQLTIDGYYFEGQDDFLNTIINTIITDIKTNIIFDTDFNGNKIVICESGVHLVFENMKDEYYIILKGGGV